MLNFCGDTEAYDIVAETLGLPLRTNPNGWRPYAPGVFYGARPCATPHPIDSSAPPDAQRTTSLVDGSETSV